MARVKRFIYREDLGELLPVSDPVADAEAAEEEKREDAERAAYWLARPGDEPGKVGKTEK